MKPAGVETAVERYAGYKGDETPRAVIFDGMRLEVIEILLRKRVLDPASSRIRDIWRCRLADGRQVVVERLDGETWRVSAAA
ncbi:MAG: hypothetical protein WCC00_02000 [Candidatus Aminicenantales bacterium]